METRWNQGRNLNLTWPIREKEEEEEEEEEDEEEKDEEEEEDEEEEVEVEIVKHGIVIEVALPGFVPCGVSFLQLPPRLENEKKRALVKVALFQFYDCQLLIRNG